jgi:hypothetical protein
MFGCVDRTGGTGIGMPESDESADEVSDEFGSVNGFSVEGAELEVWADEEAAVPAPDDPAFFSGGVEHPAVTASTKASTEADQRNNLEKSNRMTCVSFADKT